MPHTDPYRRLFHIGAAVVIILLLGILYISLKAEDFSALNLRLFGWIAIGIVVVAVVAAQILAAAEGLWQRKRKYAIEVADGKLIARPAGSAAVQISLDKIRSLEEGRGWLVVTSEVGEKIMIPQEISDFELLRRELAAHRDPTSLKQRVPLLSIFMFCLTAAAYVLLFTSHRRNVIGLSGAVALVAQAWAILPVLRRSRGRRTPILLYYAALLLLMAWIIFQRMKGVF